MKQAKYEKCFTNCQLECILKVTGPTKLAFSLALCLTEKCKKINKFGFWRKNKRIFPQRDVERWILRRSILTVYIWFNDFNWNRWISKEIYLDC